MAYYHYDSIDTEHITVARQRFTARSSDQKTNRHIIDRNIVDE